MAHKIEDLRDHLFGTLAALRDPQKPMEVERAKAIADVAKVIVESAKVEVQAMEIAGATHGTGFIALPEKTPPARPALTVTPQVGAAISKGK